MDIFERNQDYCAFHRITDKHWKTFTRLGVGHSVPTLKSKLDIRSKTQTCPKYLIPFENKFC